MSISTWCRLQSPEQQIHVDRIAFGELHGSAKQEFAIKAYCDYTNASQFSFADEFGSLVDWSLVECDEAAYLISWAVHCRSTAKGALAYMCERMLNCAEGDQAAFVQSLVRIANASMISEVALSAAIDNSRHCFSTARERAWLKEMESPRQDFYKS